MNIIEDIARLPADLQKPAYEVIKSQEMDKKEALEYLRSIKRDAEVLILSDDVKGLIESYSENKTEEVIGLSDVELGKYLKKIDRDLEKLTTKVRSGTIVEREKVIPVLQSLMDRLNLLYTDITSDNSIGQPIYERVDLQ